MVGWAVGSNAGVEAEVEVEVEGEELNSRRCGVLAFGAGDEDGDWSGEEG